MKKLSGPVLTSRRGPAVCAALLILLAGLVAAACSSSGGASSGMASRPAMGIEKPGGSSVSLPVAISGWAIDRAATGETGVDLVQILDDGCDGTVIGIAEYGIERTDIGQEYGAQYVNSGFQFNLIRLETGPHTLAVRSRSTVTEDFSYCETLFVTVGE